MLAVCETDVHSLLRARWQGSNLTSCSTASFLAKIVQSMSVTYRSVDVKLRRVPMMCFHRLGPVCRHSTCDDDFQSRYQRSLERKALRLTSSIHTVPWLLACRLKPVRAVHQQGGWTSCWVDRGGIGMCHVLPYSSLGCTQFPLAPFSYACRRHIETKEQMPRIRHRPGCRVYLYFKHQGTLVHNMRYAVAPAPSCQPQL